MLWLDAHPDFHTLDSTVSGNLHGVPMAYVTGRESFAGWYPPLVAPVKPENVCMVGLRSVDPAEREALARSAIAVHDMRAIDEHGIGSLVGAFLDKVAARGGILHVSFDVDFLDPGIAPGVGTTVPGGATFREAHLVMEMLHDTGLVRSLDVVELEPLPRRARPHRPAAGRSGRQPDGPAHPRPADPELVMTRALNLVPFVSVANMMRLVNAIGVERFLTELAGFVEEDFRRWPAFDKIARLASHSAEGVIELMPTSDGVTYGFKYVNGHPKNMREGRQTVTAFGLLAEVSTGYPELLSEMTILTALRTAATSAVAAKHLARPGLALDGDHRQRRAVGVPGARLQGAGRNRSPAALRHRPLGEREMRRQSRPLRLRPRRSAPASRRPSRASTSSPP